MLVLNASGIILGDKRVNNWFEREIEKSNENTNITFENNIPISHTLGE